MMKRPRTAAKAAATAAAKTVPLSDILSRRPCAVSNLLTFLRTKGYAAILLDDSRGNSQHRQWRDGISAGLDEASRLGIFRFPPIDSDQRDVRYTDASRRCFGGLFGVATGAFAAIASASGAGGGGGWDHLPPELSGALDEWGIRKQRRRSNGTTPGKAPGFNLDANAHGLFGPNFDGHEPFIDPANEPFGQTFFNLFNYNNGLLNAHKDRGLVTVVASRTGGGDDAVGSCRRSALWVKGPGPSSSSDSDMGSSAGDDGDDGQWRNLDLEIGQNADVVALFLGEDGERALGPFARRAGLYAAEHAVRVDPRGGYVSRSHYRPDPEQCEAARGGALEENPTSVQQPPTSRTSAAMILRHDF